VRAKNATRAKPAKPRATTAKTRAPRKATPARGAQSGRKKSTPPR
jgi:hypothetical protein